MLVRVEESLRFYLPGLKCHMINSPGSEVFCIVGTGDVICVEMR